VFYYPNEPPVKKSVKWVIAGPFLHSVAGNPASFGVDARDLLLIIREREPVGVATRAFALFIAVDEKFEVLRSDGVLRIDWPYNGCDYF